MKMNNNSTRFIGNSSIPELIPVNLIFDYPVDWSRYKVFRDFVQNFYDSIGHKEWSNRFSYSFDGETLKLTAKDVAFSYDWLVHIGASTKRQDNDTYAGYFGEGFKIASLCALRDHGWSVEMASKEWELQVVVKPLKVDNKLLKSIAYNIWKSDHVRRDTHLWLSPVSKHDMEIFNTVLLSFYYKDNILFGKKIWESDHVAVYKRSSVPKPIYYPSTFDEYGPGIIFATYQALGSFQYPLIFCLHNYRVKDRERGTFYKMDVVKVIEKTVRQLPPSAALEVLECLKIRWYDRPKKRYDFETWAHIIQALTRIISQSQEYKESFRKKYPNLLVASLVDRTNINQLNRRRQAMAWLRNSDQKYKLVQDGFKAIGYPTLEEECEKHDGFSILRQPHGIEIKLIDILETVSKIILIEFLEDIDYPECRIIKTDNAIWSGMASCHRVSPRQTARGLKVRFRLPYVAIKSKLLTRDSFGLSLSTYLHEIAHIFGGDRSASFSHALTEILEISLQQTQLIESFRLKWEELFN
jgi:hypothetical protein